MDEFRSYEEVEKYINKGSSFAWSEDEYIHYKKEITWYLYLFFATIILGIIMYFISADIWWILVLAMVAATIVFYAIKEPRNLNYQISDETLTIDQRNLPLDHFKSFSLISEAGKLGVILQPVQRFKPEVLFYFKEEDRDSVLPFLEHQLTREIYDPGIADRLINKLKF